MALKPYLTGIGRSLIKDISCATSELDISTDASMSKMETDMFGMRHSYGCAPGGWGARRGWRGHFGQGWGGRHGMGGNMMRAGRMLAQGDLRLIALALIAEQPRHGYEIIKVLEEKTSGWYSPSPGIV